MIDYTMIKFYHFIYLYIFYILILRGFFFFNPTKKFGKVSTNIYKKDVQFTNIENIPFIDGKNQTKKVMIFFGTRPEVIKLAPVIKEMEKSQLFNVLPISTGQHSSMLKQALHVFGIKPYQNLNVMTKSQSLSNLTSKLIVRISKILEVEKPDLVIVQGDTTTSFSAALEAFYYHIPIAHVEAGLRTNNIYSPFPEEFNRKTIGELANYNFAATDLAKNNLLKEGTPIKKIFVTGNPVVDSLFSVLNHTKPTEELQKIFKEIEHKCSDCTKIVLTTHRRENQGKPMEDIFHAAFDLLKYHSNLIIVFPMHKNPSVKNALENVITTKTFDMIENHKEITDPSISYLNRFFLIEPLDYLDMVHLMKWSTLLLTDSGGIQEEGVSIGKPVFVLRESTERQEAIESGSAKLVGTNRTFIFKSINRILTNKPEFDSMTKFQSVYGDGFAAKKIVKILTNKMYSNYFEPISKAIQPIKANTCYDLVILLTVWRRDTLYSQIQNVVEQTALEQRSVAIIIFQNGNHVNVDNIVHYWETVCEEKNIKLIHIHSILDSGYFGRFLAPLTIDGCSDSYFFINDDDVMFGTRYYENMIRVVDDGYLCTSNGRVINFRTNWLGKKKLYYQNHLLKTREPVVFEDDLLCDFGGHVWAGKMKWLKEIWKYPPLDISTAEDFWISSVLRTKLGIKTKKAKCPMPKGKTFNYNGEYCACDMKTSRYHKSALFGNAKAKDSKRLDIIKQLSNHLKYPFVKYESPESFDSFLTAGKIVDESYFNMSGFLKGCYNWVC